MLIWAHRGACKDAPENTLEAFELAVAQGADGVEFDVQLSADGIPVVIHDETVDRTTSTSGPVAGFSADELSALGVPTLADVCALLQPTGLTMNVELKNSIVAYPGLEAKVLDVCHGWGKRVWYSSFRHASMAEVLRLAPLAQVGLLLAELPDDGDIVATAKAMGAQALHPHFSLLPMLRGCGLRLHAWTETNPGNALGADALITNEPAASRSLLR